MRKRVVDNNFDFEMPSSMRQRCKSPYTIRSGELTDSERAAISLIVLLGWPIWKGYLIGFPEAKRLSPQSLPVVASRWWSHPRIRNYANIMADFFHETTYHVNTKYL